MPFSLKKLSKISLFVALTLGLFVILGNFVLIPIIANYVDENQSYTNTTYKAYQDLGYRLSILNNIHEVVDRDGASNISHAMATAYNRNLTETIDILNHIQEQLSALDHNLNWLNKISLPYRSNLITIAKDLISELDAKISAFDVTRLAHYDFSYMQQILSVYDTTWTAVNELIAIENDINNKISTDITWIVNVLIISLLFQLAFYAYITYYLVNEKLDLLIKSLHMIANHQYDRSNLSSQKIRFKEERAIQEAIDTVFDEGEFTKNLTEVLAVCYEVDDLMEALFKLVAPRLALNRIGIAFVDYQNQKFIAEYGVMDYGTVKLGPGFEVGFHDTSLTHILDHKTTVISEDLKATYNKNPSSKALPLLINEGIASNMTIPLRMNGSVFGLVFFSSNEVGHFKEVDKAVGEKIISSVSALLIRAYFTKIVLNKVTSSFSELVDQKDNDTGEHLERMTIYSLIVARGLKAHKKTGYIMTDKFLLELERNASAHDIGKVGIPDTILKKPGKLTPDEWAIMKTHAALGADIFRNLRQSLHLFGDDFFHYAEMIARSHHEKWDGSGYPDGLIGEAIPLAARIVAIGDVFDALTSKRVYKDAFSFEDSVATMVAGKGHHFDPFLIDVFLEQIDTVKKIYMKKF